MTHIYESFPNPIDAKHLPPVRVDVVSENGLRWIKVKAGGKGRGAGGMGDECSSSSESESEDGNDGKQGERG